MIYNWLATHKQIFNNKWVNIRYNKKGSAMGRCGGGWLWKFGIMGGRTSIVIELTFIMIRLYLRGTGK